MQYLSHRGFWLQKSEQNTEAAFLRSFASGFGLETDVRDLNGSLVIAHNPPDQRAMPFERFLECYRSHGAGLPIALNVKADGLQDMFIELLRAAELDSVFFFDMAVPDAIGYLRRNLPMFTRLSEYERLPSFLAEAEGVWVDAFNDEWFGADDLQEILDKGKRISVVSPELHGRPHLPLWESLKEWGIHLRDDVALCTDFPAAAKNWFGSND